MTTTTSTSVLVPAGTAGFVTTTLEVMMRTLKQLQRSPQVVGIAVVQSVLFLLMFRYVLGGAIAVPGVSYANYLVPGFVVSGMLFTAGGSAVAVAEDRALGLHDRFRSLPIPDIGVLLGRVIADTLLLTFVGLVTTVIGTIVGFRVGTGPVEALLALAIFVVGAFGFSWVFLLIGLLAGNAQAAQGLAIIGVPFSFLSSAFVPTDSMPKALEVFAEHQPLSFMVNAARGLLLGDRITQHLAQPLSYYVLGSFLWALVLTVAFAPIALMRYRKA